MAEELDELGPDATDEVDADTPTEEVDGADEVDDDVADEVDGDVAVASAPASSAWLAWTVVVALALVAAVTTVQWRAVAGPAAQVDAAADAAAAYVTTLSNWDAAEGLDGTYSALLAAATEGFATEVDEIFGAETRDQLVAIDAVSTGTILERLTGELREADAESGTPTTVPVIIIVDQLILTGPTADPALQQERVASLRMVRVDGTWLVDDVELISELETQEGDA